MATAKYRRARARAVRLIAAGALVVAGANIAGQGVATAVHDEEFQLDVPNANVTDEAAAAEDFDWVSFFNASGQPSPALPDPSRPNFVASGFRADGALPDSTTYTQGSKDTLPIGSGWTCTRAQNVGDKVDILNAYATAYIRPGDNHLILYYGVEKASPLGTSNIGVWFLKDGTVDCNSPGGSVNFTGGHVDGDILLVSEFSNGGAVATVKAYEWVGNDVTGSLNTTPIASGQICGAPNTDDSACSTVNKGNFVDPPWPSVDKNGDGGPGTADDGLDPLEFFEGGVDVGVAGTDTCFATFLANTRTSTSLTSDKPDYARGTFPVCGGLTVKKYIDVDLSGSLTTGDIESGTAVQGWAFTVTGPGADTTVRCSGTTDATGTLVCGAGQTLTNLTPGTYHVTETQKTGFFNTDPGDADLVNVNATVTKDVVVGVSGATGRLGNTCFVDKTFQISGVPSGISSITVNHTIASGPTPFGSTGSLNLTNQGGGVWSGAVNDRFVQTNTIDWTWYINGDNTNQKTGGTGDSLAGGAFPVCADTNSDTFPLSTLNGFKYKDVNNNGDFDTGDLNGAGFTFDLKSGATVVQTAVSGSDGTYSFTNVAPGTYTVAERDETGWTQTEPAGGNSVDRTVTVPFNTTPVTIGDFGNHPLSTISASFTAQAVNPGTATPATQATITCAGQGTLPVTNLPIGTYNCTIVITDP